MKKIYIVRHGESEGNVKNISKESEYIIDSEIKLTEKGLDQAMQAGETLNGYLQSKNGAFWVSPFTRTRETFYAIFENINYKYRGYDYIEDPRLVEQDFGDFDFQFYERWKEISPHSYYINQARYNNKTGRFFARLENGENMLDVYNRMSLFVTTRLEKSKYKENVIITHGNASRALIMFLLNSKVEDYYDSKTPPNASIRQIIYKNGKYIDKGYLN